MPSIWSIYTYMHDKRPCCLLRRPREIEFSFSLDAVVLHNALHKHKQTILYGNFSLWLKNIKEGIYHVLPKHVVQCSWPLIAIHKSPGYGLERCEHCHRVVPTKSKRIGDTCMPEGGTHHHHHYTSARLPGREQFSSVLVCIDSSPLTDVYLVPLFYPTHRVKFINCRLRIL